MKKLLFLLLALIIISPNISRADEDLWDNFEDSNVYGQKPVSDEEFDQAIESKKKKQKRDKNIPKGEEFSQSNETEMLSNTSKDLPIILIPLDLKLDTQAVLPTGHYQIEGVKENGKTYLKLYQAHRVIAKLPATETSDDFDEKTINFAKLVPHGDYHVKIIYGGIDFNAYTVIDTKE